MKRLRIIVPCLLLAMCGVVLISFAIPRDPIYQGRPISEWIDALSGQVSTNAARGERGANPQPHKPGGDIVPYIAETLRKGNSAGEKLYARHFEKLPAFIRRRLPVPNPSRDAELRYRAALILYYLGPEAESAAPQLIRALRDPDANVRRVAVTALGNSEPNKKVLRAVSAALDDSSGLVRQAGLETLFQLNLDPSFAVPVFAAHLKDPDELVRVRSAKILRELGIRGKLALPKLIEALRDENPDVVRFAAQALGRIGPAAKDALPALRQALDPNIPSATNSIRLAIRRIEPPAPAPGN